MTDSKPNKLSHFALGVLSAILLRNSILPSESSEFHSARERDFQPISDLGKVTGDEIPTGQSPKLGTSPLENLTFTISIFSKPNRLSNRNALRQTWVKKLDQGRFRYHFILDNADEDLNGGVGKPATKH